MAALSIFSGECSNFSGECSNAINWEEVNMDNAQTLLAMPGVGFIGMLIIGLLAGWIAEKVTASDHGLLTNLLVGIAGSFVGGTLANVMNVEFYGWLGNLIVASIGAILILWIWRSVRGPAAT
jgi:uncharacterized membrane protein YeaQ/YmgE (transglycosylase-associated protein family)